MYILALGDTENIMPWLGVRGVCVYSTIYIDLFGVTPDGAPHARLSNSVAYTPAYE